MEHPAVSFQDIQHAVRRLHLSGKPLCVHASLRSFGWVDGGPATVIDALLAEGCTVMVPTHSYSYAIPAPGRAAVGGPVTDCTRAVFTPDSMVIDRAPMGALPAAVLAMPGRVRGNHPLDSFTAVGPLARQLIAGQSPRDPYAPLRALAKGGGWVLLIGVGLDKLTLLHLAEQLAGRPLSRCWAYTPSRKPQETVIGGCSDGFVNLEPVLASLAAEQRVGASRWRAWPVPALLDAAIEAIQANPAITHCANPRCDECNRAVTGYASAQAGTAQV